MCSWVSSSVANAVPASAIPDSTAEMLIRHVYMIQWLYRQGIHDFHLKGMFAENCLWQRRITCVRLNGGICSITGSQLRGFFLRQSIFPQACSQWRHERYGVGAAEAPMYFLLVIHRTDVLPDSINSITRTDRNEFTDAMERTIIRGKKVDDVRHKVQQFE